MSPKFPINERLSESAARSLGAEVVVPLHERVDQLCDLVYAAGHARPPKRKMLSALILNAPEDAAELTAMLDAYDRATTAEALVGSTTPGDVVEFPKRRPGPRPGSRR